VIPATAGPRTIHRRRARPPTTETRLGNRDLADDDRAGSNPAHRHLTQRPGPRRPRLVGGQPEGWSPAAARSAADNGAAPGPRSSLARELRHSPMRG
jgi:hypothetical protein